MMVLLCPFEVPAIEEGKNNQLKVIVDVTHKNDCQKTMKF